MDLHEIIENSVCYFLVAVIPWDSVFVVKLNEIPVLHGETSLRAEDLIPMLCTHLGLGHSKRDVPPHSLLAACRDSRDSRDAVGNVPSKMKCFFDQGHSQSCLF